LFIYDESIRLLNSILTLDARSHSEAGCISHAHIDHIRSPRASDFTGLTNSEIAGYLRKSGVHRRKFPLLFCFGIVYFIQHRCPARYKILRAGRIGNAVQIGNCPATVSSTNFFNAVKSLS
jgi:hypothetical protein